MQFQAWDSFPLFTNQLIYCMWISVDGISLKIDLKWFDEKRKDNMFNCILMKLIDTTSAHDCFRETEYINGQWPDYIWTQSSDPQPATTSPGNQPLLYSNQPRKPACSLSQTCRKSDHISSDWSQKPTNSPCNNWPKKARTWLITDSFPNFCLHLQSRTNQRKPNVHP